MTTQDSDAKPDLYLALDHYGWDPPFERPGWHSMKCLIHGEQHPSCRVNYDLQVWVCMACGAKGDVYNIIEHHEGVGFREAKRIGQELFGASGPDVRSQRGSGHTVSRGSRHTTGGGAYVPPRLRR